MLGVEETIIKFTVIREGEKIEVEDVSELMLGDELPMESFSKVFGLCCGLFGKNVKKLRLLSKEYVFQDEKDFTVSSTRNHEDFRK